jgi:hypothetical protein
MPSARQSVFVHTRWTLVSGDARLQKRILDIAFAILYYLLILKGAIDQVSC